MKNFEKFEKEIMQYDGRFAVTKEGQVVNCSGLDCKDCLFLKGCTKLKMQWLLDEYNEPILNEEEKKILTEFIEVNKKLNNSNLLYLLKMPIIYNQSKCCLCLMFENCNTSISISFYRTTIFKRMKLDKQYTLEDLGLC